MDWLPGDVHVITIDAKYVCNWHDKLTLRPGIRELIESVAGRVTDARFGRPDNPDNEWDGEPWAWFIDWDDPRNRNTSTRVVGLWFRDPRAATYFKLMWGGR